MAKKPFMQVCELPCGGQFSIHGNAPTDVNSTVIVLPTPIKEL